MNQLSQAERDLLLDKAEEARTHSYAPYSRYNVGAALLTADGQIYQGCNIENASFGVTNCAERTAIFRAIYDGHRNFKAIAVVGAEENQTDHFSDFCPPCGVCRQILREFCNPGVFKVVLAKSLEDFKILKLEELLPLSFGPNNLK